jgi:hypothetical protein
MTSVDQEIHCINMTSGGERTDGRTDKQTRLAPSHSEEIDLDERNAARRVWNTQGHEGTAGGCSYAEQCNTHGVIRDS